MALPLNDIIFFKPYPYLPMRLLLYSAVLWLLAAAPLFSQTNPNGAPIRETVFYAKSNNPD